MNFTYFICRLFWVVEDASNLHGGSYAYVISNQANGYLESGAIAVQAGASYNLGAMLRGELDGADGEGSWWLEVKFYNSSGVFISKTTVINNASLSANWISLGGSATAPTGATSARIRLYSQYTHGWLAIDDVSMMKNGTYNNLVPDPGFEAGDSGPWGEASDSLYPGTSLDCSGRGASSPYSGSYACAIGNLASGALQSASIAVSGNKQYDLYAWVNGKLDAADSAGGWHVRALYYTAGSAYIGYKDVYTGTAESSSLTWQQVGGRLMTPANAASVRLELRVEGVSGWLDFDDVSLQEVLTVNLVYDAENRLVKVLQNGTSIAAFGYDGDGLRVKQVLTTTTPTSTYFVKNYYEVAGGSATKYYYAGSQRVAMRSSVGVRYLFGDHLGSTSVSADASGGSVTKQLYKGWGEIRYTSGSLPTKYQFTGQYSYASGASADFGLIFYNARFYDPALGRFTSADTIVPGAGNPAAWDRYAGMMNNPLRYRDPSGHEACDEDGNCFNGQGYHRASNAPRLSAVERWKRAIWGKFGVRMDDNGSTHGNGVKAKEWDIDSTRQMYDALNIIDGKLGGKLKSLIGGSTFTLNDHTKGKYHGMTDTGYIDFETGGSFPSPYINIFHEVGHLINVNSKGGNQYVDAFNKSPRTWITPEGKIDTKVLKNKNVADPYWTNGTDALQGTNFTGQTLDEQWADTFANFVANNIYTDVGAGIDMANFVNGVFTP